LNNVPNNDISKKTVFNKNIKDSIIIGYPNNNNAITPDCSNTDKNIAINENLYIKMQTSINYNSYEKNSDNCSLEKNEIQNNNVFNSVEIQNNLNNINSKNNPDQNQEKGKIIFFIIDKININSKDKQIRSNHFF